MSTNKIINLSSKELSESPMIKSKQPDYIEHKSPSYKYFKDALQVTLDLIEEYNQDPDL